MRRSVRWRSIADEVPDPVELYVLDIELAEDLEGKVIASEHHKEPDGKYIDILVDTVSHHLFLQKE